MNLPEFVYQEVQKDFNRRIDDIYEETMDVMTGNRIGNQFMKKYCQALLKRWEQYKNSTGEE